MRFGLIALACIAAFDPASAAWADSNLAQRYAQWEQRLRDRVSGELAYPIAAGHASGDVLVGFRIGPDGKPADVFVQQSSGNAIFDAAAVRLVSRLGRLGPVPSAAGQVERIVLKLSYGDGAATVAQSMEVERADREERRANHARDLSIISDRTRVADRH